MTTPKCHLASMRVRSSFCHLQMGVVYVLLVLISHVSCGDSNSQCDLLMFHSVEHGCQKCSFCQGNIADNDKTIRKDCKDQHPHLIQGQKLWCDNKSGPFPVCDQLDRRITGGKLVKHEPGDRCNISCDSDEIAIKCSILNDGNSYVVRWDPKPCDPPTTQAPNTTATQDPVPIIEHRTEKADFTLHIILIVNGCVLVAILGGIAVWRYQLSCCHKKQCSSGPSSSSNSTASSSTTVNLEVPSEKHSLLGHGPAIKSEDPESVPETVFLEGDEERGKVESNGMQQRASGCGTDSQDKSYQALVDLLNSRTEAERFCTFFDQRDQFDRVTWHSIANYLLGMPADEIRSQEYLHQLQPPLCNRPTYHVLQRLRERGIGLLNLRDFLCNQEHTNQQALKFLEDFWQRWQRQTQTETST